MDTRDLKFGDGHFDCIIDKGCLDTILVLYYFSHFSVDTTLFLTLEKCYPKCIEIWTKKACIFVWATEFRKNAPLYWAKLCFDLVWLEGLLIQALQTQYIGREPAFWTRQWWQLPLCLCLQERRKILSQILI